MRTERKEKIQACSRTESSELNKAKKSVNAYKAQNARLQARIKELSRLGIEVQARNEVLTQALSKIKVKLNDTLTMLDKAVKYE